MKGINCKKFKRHSEMFNEKNTYEGDDDYEEVYWLFDCGSLLSYSADYIRYRRGPAMGMARTWGIVPFFYLVGLPFFSAKKGKMRHIVWIG
jgi:hypothetical protein